MERQGLEDSLKSAFDGAGIDPTENVWRNIELDLERAKGERLRKHVLFYQLLAAASVIFAIAFSLGIYNLGGQRYLADRAPETEGTPPPADLQEVIAPGENKEISRRHAPENSAPPISSSSRIKPADPAFTALDGGTVIPESSDRQREAAFAALAERDLPPLVPDRMIQLQRKKEAVADPVALMLARLEEREREVSGEKTEKEKERREELWSSVGFAAGSFISPNAGVSAAPENASIAMNSSLANEEVRASGQSYSMGVNLGARISERWVLQGGVNFLSQSSEFTAHNAVRTANYTTFRPASIGQLNKLSDGEFAAEKLISTAPYNVNNNIRYLTIPVQAGYLLVDRNFALQVNAGVATDLFLQNTVSAEGDNIDNASETTGGDTPYRQVNLSGLAGTELSYRFGRNYRISLNPGIRYPFNSIYKADLDVKASPLTFDLGLRFRYIFH